MNRRLTAVIAVLAAVSTVSVWVAVQSREGASSNDTNVWDLPNGPIRDRPEHGYVLEESQRGRVFTDGLEPLELGGSEPATIDTVEVVGEGGVFETLGILLAGPERTNGLTQRFEAYPPAAKSLGPVVPAEGALLQPSALVEGFGDYELLIGTRVTSDDIGLRDGLWIKYHIGDEYYSEHLQARVVFCPEGQKWRSCAAEMGITLD
jgi:hypothetical protein